MTEAINLERKLSQFSAYWSPKIVAAFNGHEVMVVKIKGEFVWHSHPDTDDFFLVLKGSLTIRLRDRDVRLGPGDSTSSRKTWTIARSPRTKRTFW